MREDCKRTLDLWVRKAIECPKLGELFCGSLKDKSVARNAEKEGLASGVSEGSLRMTLSRAITDSEYRICGSGHVGVKKIILQLTRYQKHKINPLLCWGQLMLVIWR